MRITKRKLLDFIYYKTKDKECNDKQIKIVAKCENDDLELTANVNFVIVFNHEGTVTITNEKMDKDDKCITFKEFIDFMENSDIQLKEDYDIHFSICMLNSTIFYREEFEDLDFIITDEDVRIIFINPYRGGINTWITHNI